MKNILALITAMFMFFGLGVIPVFAEDTTSEEDNNVVAEMAGSESNYIISSGKSIYSETFDEVSSDDIKSQINNQKDGWKIDGSNYSVDAGNGFSTGSVAIRYSNVAWAGITH